jgi:hypothetical protein
MDKIVTPLSFFRIDGKLEATFPVLLTEPTHEELFGTACYEEIIVWPPENSKDAVAGRSNLKVRIRSF